MTDDRRIKDDACRAESSPTAWFVMLERARQTHDFERATHAQRELERLDVKVTYSPARAQRQSRKVMSHA